MDKKTLDLQDITIVIPTNLKNIKLERINQINSYVKKNIKVILSIPPEINIKKAYNYGFSEKINIINSEYIGQVNQRQYGIRFCKTTLIIQMDDDIDFEINKIKKLVIEFKRLPIGSCLAPYLKSKEEYKIFSRIKNLFKCIFLYSQIHPNSGSISRSSFPVPHLKKINNNKNAVEEVSWLPGGIIILRSKDIIFEEYFPFKGKAYCEDLIHSFLLKKKGIKLFLSTKISFSTEIESYRSLNLKNFIEFILNDFRIRNHYRKLIKNNIFPFIIAYLYILLVYFLTKIKNNILNLLRSPSTIIK